MSATIVEKLLFGASFVLGGIVAQSCNRCPPDPAALSPGEYQVIGAPDGLGFALGATAVVDGDGVFGRITIDYEDAEGNRWSVSYR